MAKTQWTLEQLKSSLSSRKEVKFWIIYEEHVHRRERYFMAEANQLVTDQDRNIHSRNVSLKLFVYLSDLTRQGEITKKLFPSLSLKEQIDQAIEAALQTDHQTWNLPEEIPHQIPQLNTTDPTVAEDIEQVITQITKKIEAAAHKKRTTLFNSAELFLSVHHKELYLSSGLQHRTSQSRIYIESAFSFSKLDSRKKLQSDEYLTTHWAVHLNHLPIEDIFDHTSECAEHSLDVVKPLTGKYSVIVNAEVLSQLLHGHLSLLTAEHAYNGLPFIKPGDSFIPDAAGDLISLTLDPTLDYGANSTSLSDQGVLQKPLKLVDRNQVIATVTDKQFGDYLGAPPTTVRGNIVLHPGELSHPELTRQCPLVIEILQFSGLFTDPNNGTYSSEIRLAKLYDNNTGKICYLKGGSLSGSIQDNFRNLRFSKSLVNRAHFSSEGTYGQGYFGPEYALLSDVSIVG